MKSWSDYVRSAMTAVRFPRRDGEKADLQKLNEYVQILHQFYCQCYSAPQKKKIPAIGTTTNEKEDDKKIADNAVIVASLQSLAELASRGENERWNIADHRTACEACDASTSTTCIATKDTNENNLKCKNSYHAVIPLVLELMKDHPKDAPLQLYSALLLAKLCIVKEKGIRNNNPRDSIMQNHGATILLTAFQAHIHDKTIVFPLCDACNCLSQEIFEYRKELVDHGLIPLLVQALLQHAQDTSLVAKIQHVILCLFTTPQYLVAAAAAQTSASGWGNLCIQQIQQLAFVGGFQAILITYQKHPHNFEVVLHSLHLISTLQSLTGQKLLFLQAGAILPAIFGSLEYFRAPRTSITQRNLNIQQAACLALRSLAKDPNIITITEEQPPPQEKSKEGGTGTSIHQDHGTTRQKRLWYGSPQDVQTVRRNMIQQGVIGKLLITLQMFPNNHSLANDSNLLSSLSPLHEAIMETLHSLICSPEAKQMTSQRKNGESSDNPILHLKRHAGALPLLCARLEQNISCAKCCTYTCRILIAARDDLPALILCCSGGDVINRIIKTINKVLKHHCQDRVVCEAALKALAGIIHSTNSSSNSNAAVSAQMKWIHNSGIPILITVAQRLSSQVGVQIAVCILFLRLFENTTTTTTTRKIKNNKTTEELAATQMHVAVLDKLGEKQAVLLLTRAIRHHSQCVDLVRIALISLVPCVLIANKSGRFDTCLQIIRDGGLWDIIQAMMYFPNNESIQAEGCCCLPGLVHTGIATHYGVPGMRRLLPTIISAMQNFPISIKVQMMGCTMIHNYAQTPLAATGVWPRDTKLVLKDALSLFPDNQRLQNIASGALNILQNTTLVVADESDRPCTDEGSGIRNTAELAIPMEEIGAGLQQFTELSHTTASVPLAPAIPITVEADNRSIVGTDSWNVTGSVVNPNWIFAVDTVDRSDGDLIAEGPFVQGEAISIERATEED